MIGWLNSVVTVGPSGTLSSYTYARDALGRISGISSSDYGFAEAWSYAYDDLDRLTSATNLHNSALSQSFTYSIDGNILSASGIGTYSYPAVGQARPHAVTSIAGQALSYDDNGNLKTGRGRTYVWDGENRPSQILLPAQGLTSYHTYGPDGERLYKSANTGPGATLQHSLYLGGDVELAPHPQTDVITPAAC